MKRIIIVSNRLPVSVHRNREGLKVKASVGGLATGMKSVYKNMESLWIGWPGIDMEGLSDGDNKEIKARLKEENCHPLNIGKTDLDLYYFGFSNKTLWPLFHYFPQFTEYNEQYWESYQKVNQRFADEISSVIKEDDYVWIHDYQLLMLPRLVKEKHPKTTVGFFNHIPFPSYELFRLLPWRKEILEGMLGADLLGFHTYDYERHFNSCVRRMFGHEYELNQFNLGNRIVRVENFPMGIDYRKFKETAENITKNRKGRKQNLQKDISRFYEGRSDRKLILSIDRMDYSKGIPNRLKAFKRFLEKYPESRGKVSLIMLTVPSRKKVGQYQKLKREVDELVGMINGNFGDLEWTPIWYFYRTMPFENLVMLYHHADVALITPLRDGMNLVAKEYIATKSHAKGVLILSEMAGASKELNEAILINPNNNEEIADAIQTAINMPEQEQNERNARMRERLERYNVETWADHFMQEMKKTRHLQELYASRRMNESIMSNLASKLKKADQGILFLDYNGTLVRSDEAGEITPPDPEIYRLLDQMSDHRRIRLVIMSNLEKELLSHWFGRYDLTLFAEHGMWQRTGSGEWNYHGLDVDPDWKEELRPVIQSYVDRTPGSYLKEMNNVLSWQFERTDPDQGTIRSHELKDELTIRIMNMDLQILEGNKLIELKPASMNKGLAAMKLLSGNQYDFILSVGDDWTDEYLFQVLPEDAISIRVGMKKTHALYTCDSYKQVRRLLGHLAGSLKQQNTIQNV